MVRYDKHKISRGDYIHAYSDSNKYIVLNGFSYGHYWFPEEQDLHFEEGEEIVETDEPNSEEILSILTGGEGE